MTTTVITPGASQDVETAPAPRRGTPAPIPTTRLVGVELRKMFDTRSGFWLLMSIGITGLVATAATIAFAPDGTLTYFTFATAIGYPMAFILPIIAMLSVTSEWSQRSGLTTFTLVPRRGRVLAAKALASVFVAVVSMAMAFAVGAVGNLVGSGLNGLDARWDITLGHAALIVLGNLLSLFSGYMLGVLIRQSAGAVVAYFGYTAIAAALLGVLGEVQPRFAEIRGWVDFNFAQGPVFEGTMTREAWAQLGTTTTAWLLIPLAVGLIIVRRSEVK